MVHLKSASFVVIMLLHKGLTLIQSQKSLSYILARVSLQVTFVYFLPLSLIYHLMVPWNMVF